MFPRLVERREMALGPAVEGDQGFAERDADERQLVLYMRRNGRVVAAIDEAVAFEILERLRQHLLRDAVDLAHQGAVAQRP